MNRFLLQIRFIAFALLLSAASTVVAQSSYTPQSLDDVIYKPEIKDSKARNAIVNYQNGKATKLLEDRNLSVQTIREKEVIIVTVPADLLFGPNQTELSIGDADFVMNQFLDFLKVPNFYRMAIAMYHDNSASDQFSKELTDARVESVYEWFSLFANVDNVYKFSFGNTEPILPNDSMQNRRWNRRLEIYIVPGPAMIDQAKRNILR